MIEGNIRLLSKKVLVSELEAGDQIIGSVILLDDDMTERGIRPRWAKVFRVADDIDDITEGDWILVDHGRWTRSFDAKLDGHEAKFRWVDYNDIFGVQKEHPNKKTI